MRSDAVVRGAWAVLRAVVCWAVAIALMAGSFLVAFVVVVRASYSVLIGWWGTNHNDLSDIGPAIFALVVAVVVSLLAALIAMLIASAPALALIGKSGVFNRVLRRRQAAETFVEEWPL